MINPPDFTEAPDVVMIDQNQETSLQNIATRYSQISYLFARSNESQVAGIEGQDYIVFKYNQQKICFVVCDGVGSSFCGNLAAKFLGDALVDFLWQLNIHFDHQSLSLIITKFLNELTAKSQEWISDYPLPVHLSELVKAALNNQRQYGSESMFVCGRLIIPESEQERGNKQLTLCWLGDTKFQIYGEDNQIIPINNQWQTLERWSTHVGVKGIDKVHTWVNNQNHISRIIAFSDGLDSIAPHLNQLVDATNPQMINNEIEQLFDLPKSDDISLLNIQLLSVPIIKQSPIISLHHLVLVILFIVVEFLIIAIQH